MALKHPALLLRCGCEVPFDDGKTPTCPRHGIQAVARTMRMPKPNIRGVAMGPLVTTMDLPAFVGRLVGEADGK